MRTRVLPTAILALALLGGGGKCLFATPSARPMSATQSAAPRSAQTDLSPQQILDALTAASFDISELPVGFTSPRVWRADHEPAEQAHNVLGKVTVAVAGPHPLNGIIYLIFPLAANAAAYLADVCSSVPGVQIGLASTPSGF